MIMGSEQGQSLPVISTIAVFCERHVSNIILVSKIASYIPP